MISRNIWKLLHERRAVSVTIASVILVGAVLAVSFVWVFWAQSLSSVQLNNSSKAVDQSAKTQAERLVFMNNFYNWSSCSLKVDLMNSGTADNVTVKTVYITDSSGNWIKVFSTIRLIDFNGDAIVDQDLDRGEQGRIVLSSLNNLVAKTSYWVMVVTGRGSTYRYMFVTS